MKPATRQRLGRAVRILFGIAAVVFLVVAFAQTWDRRPETLALAWWRAPVAVLLAGAGLWCGFRGWAALLGGTAARRLASGFYLSQLGKYVPGGVWQVAGQIGYAVRARATVAQAATAFAIFSLVHVAAGGTVGAFTALLQPELSAPVRIAIACSLLAVGLLHRRWMRGALALLRRVRATPDDDEMLPSQRAILVCWLWGCATMVLAGSSLAVLLHGLDPGAPTVALVPTFALAWTVGFLALPLPSGIGVREAVLIALLPSVAVPALIAGSVYHRLATMAAEGAMAGAAKLRDHAVTTRTALGRTADDSTPADDG